MSDIVMPPPSFRGLPKKVQEYLDSDKAKASKRKPKKRDKDGKQVKTRKGLEFVPNKTWAWDCECTTQEPTHCYLVCAARIDKATPEECHVFDNMADYVAWLFKKDYRDGHRFYAHNLDYDISFLMSYMRDNHRGEFEEVDLIATPQGRPISVTLIYKSCTIHLIDSVPKFNMDLAKLMKTYTPLTKGTTPIYKLLSEVNRTKEDIDYCKNDVIGLAMALPEIMKVGHHLTISSDSFANWRECEYARIRSESTKVISDEWIHWEFLKRYSPIPIEVDKLMRPAYRGGFTFLNPAYERMVINNVKVIDVNSMYPAQMYYKKLPFGEPRPVMGDVSEYIDGQKYQLGIQRFRFRYAYINHNRCPFVVTKKGFMGSNQYDDQVFPKDGEEWVEECMTLQEFEYFKDAYTVTDIELLGGWVFMATDKAFKVYIDKCMKDKKNPNKAISNNAKLSMNGLYGKFAESPYKDVMKFDLDSPTLRIVPETVKSIEMANELIIDFDEHFALYQAKETAVIPEKYAELKTYGYLPIGIFTTSYARLQLLETIDSIGYNNFIYCDTDSIHMMGDSDISGLDIHPTNLGAWDHEATFTEAKYIRAKRYIGRYDVPQDGKELKIVCAGINNKDLQREIKTLEEFYEGKPIKTRKFKSGVNGKQVKPQITHI